MTTDRRPAADQRTAAEKPPYKLSIHVMRVLMVTNGTQYTSHVATCYPAPAVRTRVTVHRISSDRCLSTFLSSPPPRRSLDVYCRERRWQHGSTHVTLTRDA